MGTRVLVIKGAGRKCLALRWPSMGNGLISGDAFRSWFFDRWDITLGRHPSSGISRAGWQATDNVEGRAYEWPLGLRVTRPSSPSLPAIVTPKLAVPKSRISPNGVIHCQRFVGRA